MQYRELSPAPVLRPYVRCYWTMEAPATGEAGPQRVLPDGCVEIVINLGARFVRHLATHSELQPRVLVVGPTTRHLAIAPTGVVRLIGIRFSPGGALPFLSVAPREVRDEAPCLDDVAPPLEGPVIEELAAAGRKGVVVCSAGFVADHLEILYDLDIEARGLAEDAGLAFARTEMPNADPAFVSVLADVVRRALAEEDRA